MMSRQHIILNCRISGTTIEHWIHLAPIFIEEEKPGIFLLHCGTNTVTKCYTNEVYVMMLVEIVLLQLKVMIMIVLSLMMYLVILCIVKYVKWITTSQQVWTMHFNVKLLKLAAPFVSALLAHICNLSLNNSKFPDDWKKAKVTQILNQVIRGK